MIDVTDLQEGQKVNYFGRECLILAIYPLSDGKCLADLMDLETDQDVTVTLDYYGGLQ